MDDHKLSPEQQVQMLATDDPTKALPTLIMALGDLYKECESLRNELVQSNRRIAALEQKSQTIGR